ncbi:MAG TPA: T9SS type A sorting domain-containing protein [Bacteroidetes bacterium]|nr:T9SS type A sorting domain-containing protein [Bacteroidota bacterium]
MLRSILLPSLALFAIMGFTFLTNNFITENRQEKEAVFYAKDGNPDWLAIKDGVQILADELLRTQKANLGLGKRDELVLYRTDKDQLGFAHHRYQHYHKGVKVQGSELLIHEKNGFVQTLNGKLIRRLDEPTAAFISPKKAIELAMAHLGAERYMWESEKAEQMRKRILNDPGATYYPQPELVLVGPRLGIRSEQMELAYSLVVYASQPLMRKWVFVSAADGSVLQEVEMLHSQSQNTPGTAETRYHGTRQIITDSLGLDSFALRETTRGRGIETYDLNTSVALVGAVDFLDSDNFWDNVNDEQDEVATDAHWGAEMTFDYFLEKHGHLGIDGDSMPLVGYVHVGDNWLNARWDGMVAMFGDAAPPNSPLTALDVVGHEYTHGITDFTADLVYKDESGALNESFSDIFGAAIEFWADPATSDWLVGEDFLEVPFRSMSDPKELGDPDTYRGENWAFGNGDNGGVHTNSGVQNKWFYLLTDGGAGTNDLGNIYDVSGLGLDIAADIAFRNLKYYLTENSEFKDARAGAVQAAEDLFGPCSNEVVQTTDAWYAVGVGKPFPQLDFALVEITSPALLTCGLSGEEQVAVRLVFNDCDSSLAAGTVVHLSYQIDGGQEVVDSLVLAAALNDGDTLDFTFSVPAAQLGSPGEHVLTTNLMGGGDNNGQNDFAETTFERIYDQNIDLGAATVAAPFSGCFLADEPMTLEVGFYGCDSIAAGEEVELFYKLDDGAVVSQPVVLASTLFRGGTLLHTFSDLADLSITGRHTIDAWLNYGPDTLNQNDTLLGHSLTNPVVLRLEETVTFEAGQSSMDSFYYKTGAEPGIFISAEAAKTGSFGLQVTGGDFFDAYLSGNLTLPFKDTIWEVNERYRSEVCFCADLSNLDEARLRFNLQQTYSPMYESILGERLPWASAARVKANGVQISSDYKALAPVSSPYFPRNLDLEEFLGAPVEICFEFANLMSPEQDTAGLGDNAYLDNVRIEGLITGLDDGPLKGAGFEIYPNPGKGKFSLQFDALKNGGLGVHVFDANGRLVFDAERQVVAGMNNIDLEIENLPAGIYFVQLRTETGSLAKKIVLL